MKYIVLFLLFINIFMPLPAEEYNSESGKFTIILPDVWKSRTVSDEKGVVVRLDSKKSYLTVEDTGFEYTAPWAAHTLIEELEKNKDVTHIRQKEETLDGSRMSRVDHIYVFKGDEYHVRQNVLQTGGTIFMITFHALRRRYPLYTDRVDEVVASFKPYNTGIKDNLSKTYTNEEFSFSFDHPSRWFPVEGDTEDLPITLYPEPDVRMYVMVTPIEFMKDKATGLVFTADRSSLAAEAGLLIKSSSKRIIERLKKKMSHVNVLRKYSTEVDGQLAMELIIEYQYENGDTVTEAEKKYKMGVRKEGQKIKEIYIITTSGANILSIAYSAPKELFNHYFDAFEDIIESVKVKPAN